ncbi:MAG: asparagine--tRNA ligase [Armatimonadetes bacterium]|nr:asparagine--tRNA ligase [Armatimonadota bacterium]
MSVVSVKQAYGLPPGSEITVRGWVRSRRDSKGVSFIDINDGSQMKGLQAVIEAGTVDDQILHQLTTGSCVSATGALVASPSPQQPIELKLGSLHLYGTADPAAYPLQKKGHTMEFLREIAHLRPRSNTFGAVFRVRSALSFAIHKFFIERGFYYIHTPIISTSDCEGAGSMFEVHTPGEPFFGKEAFLTVSGQLEAETLALALEKVYTFGPTFRAENSNTPRHLAEFWMIEPEMAFYELEDNMRLAEEFLKFIIHYLLENCADDLEFFNQRIEPTLIETLRGVAESSFAHVTYTEAVEILQKAGREWEFRPFWGCDLQTEHERYLSEESFKRPVIVTDYPKEIKAFYMRMNDDERTVRAMDVLAPRVGEIIGGSQREERLEPLRQRMIEAGLSEEAYWWYLDLRRYGTAPHSGFGLGLERMMMYVTGMKNIRDVTPFPRTPGNAEF